jgi:hypothetical protein
MNNGDALIPANPVNYTVQFTEDPTVFIQAQCSQVPGSYTLIGSSLAVTFGPSARRWHFWNALWETNLWPIRRRLPVTPLSRASRISTWGWIATRCVLKCT